MLGLSFLNPFLLLGLLGLPLLYFILRASPERPQKQQFGGMYFLQQLQENQETPQKTPWYILLLRMLIIASLIIACATPLWQKYDEQNAINAEDVIIMVDDGYLSAHHWRDRQTTLRQLAEMSKIQQQNLYVMLLSEVDPTQQFNAINATQFIEQIGDINPKATSIDYQTAGDIFQNISKEKFAERKPVLYFMAPSAVQYQEAADQQAKHIRDFLRDQQTWASVKIITDPPERATNIYIQSTNYNQNALQVQLWADQPIMTPITRQLQFFDRQNILFLQKPVTIEAQLQSVEVVLPNEYAQNIGRIQIQEQQNAGAVHLMDGRNRQYRVGLITSGGDMGSTSLASGAHYITSSLRQFADVQFGSIEELLINQDTKFQALILNDVANYSQAEAEAMDQFIRQGGVVIQFAGAKMADAILSQRKIQGQLHLGDFIPVPLRRGDRAFGGALTWDEAQGIEAANQDSPIAFIPIPEDIKVRRQILAAPNGLTNENNWLWLEDQTPIITAGRKDNGMVFLFHVTATPDWSDLPLSIYFTEILQKMVAMSFVESRESFAPDYVFTPFSLLDGFGHLSAVTGQSAPYRFTGAELEQYKMNEMALTPGLYDKAESPTAINMLQEKDFVTQLAPSDFGALSVQYFGEAYQVNLVKYFILMAFILLLLDFIAMIYLQNYHLWLVNRLTGGKS